MRVAAAGLTVAPILPHSYRGVVVNVDPLAHRVRATHRRPRTGTSAKEVGVTQSLTRRTRHFTREDAPAVASLLNERRLVGQPFATPEMLLAPVAGDAIDRWFYDQLVETRVLVVEEDANVVGAVAWGTTHDEIRDLLWLAYAREDLLGDLLAAALAGWTGPVRAFWYASTITLGQEGLPRAPHEALHRLLTELGFVGQDLWSYQMCELDGVAPGGPRPQYHQRVALADASGTPVGEYEYSIGSHGIGVLWWLGVDEPYRRQGHGARALDRVLTEMRSRGVSRVILYVDDDDVTGERDRTAAKALYASRGFHEEDRLWSYSRPSAAAGRPDC